MEMTIYKMGQIIRLTEHQLRSEITPAVIKKRVEKNLGIKMTDKQYKEAYQDAIKREYKWYNNRIWPVLIN